MKTQVSKIPKMKEMERPVMEKASSTYDTIADTLGTMGNQAALGFIQTKMKVGAPGDAAELEADRIASAVAGSAYPVSEAGGGDLEAKVKESIGKRLGSDFSGIRIHNDSDAARRANAIGARAFTSGGDIYFGRGEYAPETTEGRELLVHELTHTVQQGVVEQSGGDMAVQQSADSATAQRKLKTPRFIKSIGNFFKGIVDKLKGHRGGTGAPQDNQGVPVMDENGDLTGETAPPIYDVGDSAAAEPTQTGVPIYSRGDSAEPFSVAPIDSDTAAGQFQYPKPGYGYNPYTGEDYSRMAAAAAAANYAPPAAAYYPAAAANYAAPQQYPKPAYGDNPYTGEHYGDPGDIAEYYPAAAANYAPPAAVNNAVPAAAGAAPAQDAQGVPVMDQNGDLTGEAAPPIYEDSPANSVMSQQAETFSVAPIDDDTATGQFQYPKPAYGDNPYTGEHYGDPGDIAEYYPAAAANYAPPAQVYPAVAANYAPPAQVHPAAAANYVPPAQVYPAAAANYAPPAAANNAAPAAVTSEKHRKRRGTI